MDGTSRRSHVALAVLMNVVVVGVFGGAYAAGHDQGPSGPPRTTVTVPVGGSTSTTTTSASSVTPTSLVPGTDEFGKVTFFINTTSDLAPNGCTADLTYTWTFDPARLPPAGTDVLIAVTGPDSSDTYHQATTGQTLTLTVQASLTVAGTWTALVLTVGGQDADPQPIWVELTGNC